MVVMVWEGVREKCVVMRGQVKAPRMPVRVEMMEIRAMAGEDMEREVLAKRMAVLETVAIASEIKNQERRNRVTSRSWRARRRVE